MARKTRPQRSAPPEADLKHQPAGQLQIFRSINGLQQRVARFVSPFLPLVEILAVVFLIAAGIFFRLEDLDDWKKMESRTFFEGQPLHTTFDAYFYLSLAKDLVDNTYHAVDEKRGVPDSPPRPMPPPLISVLAAQIVKYSNWQLSWVGAVLPAVLGGLAAVPIYLLMRFYSGGFAGFTAALLALIYPFYIYRSGLGRYDTDCLNITFILISAYLFIKFALITHWKRYFYFGLALVNYLLFIWWWDQTPAVVTAITFLPFIVAVVFYYRPSKKEASIFCGFIAACLLLVLSVKGPGVFIRVLETILHQFLYISKDASGDFPNIGVTISEQTIPPLSLIIEYTTGSAAGFLFAAAGLGFLFYRRFKDSLFLGSIIILSLLSFTYANRFILFLVPVLAIGSGFLLGELWKLQKKFPPVLIISPVLFVCLFWPLYRDNAQNAQFPKITSAAVAGMDAALHKTPQDSVIWAWWDNGYALTYFSRRATINDGSIHSGERTFYNALPMAMTDYRQSANFIHFYVARGMDGMNQFNASTRKSKNQSLELLKSILAAGPEAARALIEQAQLQPTPQCRSTEDWLSFFFPPNKRPVYVFLDSLMARVSYWWYWFGTWNPDTRDGTHPFYQVFSGLQMKDAIIGGSKGLQVNTTTGEIRAEDKAFQLAGLSIRTRSEFKERKFTANSKYFFEFNEPGRYGALAEKNIAETVFNKLYVRNAFDKNYFKPVDMYGMIYQLWEVGCDSYAPSAKSAD